MKPEDVKKEQELNEEELGFVLLFVFIFCHNV